MQSRLFTLLMLCAVVVHGLPSEYSLVTQAHAQSGNATQTDAEPELRIAILAAEARFDNNTMELTSAGISSLEHLLGQLDEFEEILSIRITGHTDNVGSDATNKKLSSRRADFIRQFFAKKYARVHIVAAGLGESQPVASNATQDGRKQNRRVEIQVIARGYMPANAVGSVTNN